MSSVSASSAIASATGTPKAPPQGGVLEGVNPVHYDSKNPLVLFIVQVRLSKFTGMLPASMVHFPNHANFCTTGRHHHHLLPRS